MTDRKVAGCIQIKKIFEDLVNFSTGDSNTSFFMLMQKLTYIIVKQLRVCRFTVFTAAVGTCDCVSHWELSLNTSEDINCDCAAFSQSTDKLHTKFQMAWQLQWLLLSLCFVSYF